MSEDNNKPKPNPLKTQPIKKTSAVPLRKETVRVTLKAPAKPGAAPAPPAPTAPSAAAPAPAPTIPLGGGAPKPPVPTTPMTPEATKPMEPTSAVDTKVDLPDVTSAVPLKQETMRVTLKADDAGGPPKPPSAPAAPAPTIPLGGAPKPAAPAPTVQLQTGGAATGPTTVPLATQPLQKAGSSQPLPKATVQLQQTQQLTQNIGSPTQAATIQTVTDEESSSGRAGSMVALAVAAFVISLVVLYLQFDHSKVWLEKEAEPDYMKIFEAPKGK